MRGREEEHDLQALLERLDRAVPPGTRAVGEADGDPLVQAARRLAQGPDVHLTAAAQARIEARLRAQVATRPIHPPQSRPAPRLRHLLPALRVAAVLAVMLLVGLFGVAQAAADSLPGDRLYPVKRALEDARLALVSAQSEPALRVDVAGRRLDEFERLLARRQVYPPVLFAASEHLTRALDLLGSGHGDRARLAGQIAALTQRQTALITRAASLASFTDFQQLGAAQHRNLAVQERLAQEGGVPGFRPDYTPTPTPTATLAPTETHTPTPAPPPTSTATPTPTSTPTPTPTATTTPTPTATLARTGTVTITVTPSATPGKGKPKDGAPTRTPPGHGPTPGLGDNPPGQGGAHPGIGNEGQPPGQSKPEKKP